MVIPSANEMRRSEKRSNAEYAAEIANENIDELVAQVRKAIEEGTISGTLLLSKITRVTGCTVVTAEKIKAIIKGE
jgi:hypothetical protein